jgi:hypothetical protein
VPAVVIAEEELVPCIDGEPLMSVCGHREDSELAGKGTLGEEGILSTIEGAAIDWKCVGGGRGLRNIRNRPTDADGCGIVHRGCGRGRDWLRCRFSCLELWRLACDPSKKAAYGATRGSAPWVLQRFHLGLRWLVRASNRSLLIQVSRGRRGVGAGKRGRWLLLI